MSKSTKISVGEVSLKESLSSAAGVRSDVGDNMETREAAALTVDEILSKLDANFDHGLPGVEVERRRNLHDGFNEMNIKKDEPLWKKYIEQVNEKDVYSNPALFIFSISLRIH